MRVEVSFQIEEDALSDAIIALGEAVTDERTDLVPLLEALRLALPFEVQPGDEDGDPPGTCAECGSYYGRPRPTFPCKCDDNMDGRCPDCGMLDEDAGHQTCPQPKDHDGGP